MVISALVLGIVAVGALLLAAKRRSPPERRAERNAVARMLAVAVGFQGAHLAEETATGFHQRFPALFGLPTIPLAVFLSFNLLWIGIWIASIRGVRAGSFGACFAAWFLALAGGLNGVAHPLLAVAVGGYFPGLATSPFIGGAAALLGRRLLEATVATPEPPGL